jgi:hypothetical protein
LTSIDGRSEGYHSAEEDYGTSSSAPTHPISDLKRIRLHGLDFFSDRHGYVHGYCDGAFKRKTASIGIWFSPDHPKYVSLKQKPQQFSKDLK